MKKTLRTISGYVMVMLLLMGACQEKPKETKDDQPVTPEEVDTPKQIISLADADSLYVNYTDRRAQNTAKFEMAMQEDDDKPFVPTRFVTFDLDAIKKYIAYVEQEAAKGGTEVDSLRIYLGNYGDSERGWKKKRRNTVFIVPAAKVGNEYGGIYIGDDGKAKLIRDLFNGGQNGYGGQEGEPKSEASFMPSFNTNLIQPGGGSLIMNEGGLSPPPSGDF